MKAKPFRDLSYWERKSFQTYDVIIVGGGIVGLSTAVSVKEKDRSLSVAVLERGVFPTGASTRNAGFACFGSPSELLSDIDVMGENETLDLVIRRWSGLKKLRQRLGDSRIRFQNKGGFELLTKERLQVLEKIDYLNEILYPIFEKRVFEESKTALSQFQLDDQFFCSAIFNPLEGQLDTGEMMKSLQGYAQLLGVNILSGIEVQTFQENQNQIVLSVRSNTEDTELKASQMAVCTNAFSQQFFKNLDIKPGRGLVLITEPIKNLQLSGTFNFDEGFNYFRDIDDRILLGGGRNLAFDEEGVDQFGINEKIFNHLRKLLFERILQKEVEIEMSWSGIMAFGKDKQPIIRRESDKIVIGVKLGGMGVAMGTLVGEELADLLIGE
ncbi:MAG: FAD-dependent oxidoreductase [Bacteroidetes bacterium]|nr:FAD-dependent oxidoreductase [Bacteroidota bacterium]MDA1119023.1 FAD-dependent oxidoreductase [Bacteroidota bacterium]